MLGGARLLSSFRKSPCRAKHNQGPPHQPSVSSWFVDSPAFLSPGWDHSLCRFAKKRASGVALGSGSASSPLQVSDSRVEEEAANTFLHSVPAFLSAVAAVGWEQAAENGARISGGHPSQARPRWDVELGTGNFCESN